MRQGFETIHPKAQQIIEHGNDWKLWVLCDREPVDRWRDGNVVLLGDAAHPMLQYFAQGACMALEDAVCLAHLMDNNRATSEALAAYEAQRVVRTARVQISSRLIGEYIYHPDGAKAKVRDQVLQSWRPEEYYQRLDWIYGKTGLG